MVEDQRGGAFDPTISHLLGLGTTIRAGLRKGCHPEWYTPPPKFSAQLFSVGRSHLCFPHDTRGSRTFCVCQGVVRHGAYEGQFDPFLPSVLSESLPTFSP